MRYFFISSGSLEADEEGCPDTSRSTGSSHLVLLNDHIISCSSKIMTDSAKMSSAEGGFIQVGLCTRSCLFFFNISRDFLAVHCTKLRCQPLPLIGEEDNKGAVDVTQQV